MKTGRKAGAGTLKLAAAACLCILLAQVALACGSGGSNVRAAEEEPQGKAAIAAYRAYLVENSALLVRAIQAMLPEIEHGAVSRAESRYARARVRYAGVEPFASTFSTLDSSIDAHPDEVPESELRGFHRIERALWEEHSAVGMTPITRELLTNAKRLEERFENATLSGARIAAGTQGVLTATSSSTLADKAEPFSHIALVDAAGNVEGVEAAFTAVRPLLIDDEELASEIEAQLERLHTAVGEYGIFASAPEQQRDRSPGVSFVVFTGFSQAEIEKIGKPAEALADLFSEVQERFEES